MLQKLLLIWVVFSSCLKCCHPNWIEINITRHHQTRIEYHQPLEPNSPSRKKNTLDGLWLYFQCTCKAPQHPSFKHEWTLAFSSHKCLDVSAFLSKFENCIPTKELTFWQRNSAKDSPSFLWMPLVGKPLMNGRWWWTSPVASSKRGRHRHLIHGETWRCWRSSGSLISFWIYPMENIWTCIFDDKHAPNMPLESMHWVMYLVSPIK